MPLTRRATVLGLGAVAGLGRARLALGAPAAGAQRLVVVILRGAMDGLSAVVPYGDAGLATLRAPLVPPGPGAAGGLGDLGGFYGLHPALRQSLALYRGGELLAVHAVAGPWRVRSHFEAQDDLESGAGHRLDSGWLNRVVAQLAPPVPAPVAGTAMAIGVDIPLLLRGAARVGSWAPAVFGKVSPDLYDRAAALAAADPVIGPALAEGLAEQGFTDAALVGARHGGAGHGGAEHGFTALAAAAGTLLARADGPRIAALELDGWDTHVAQVPRLRYMLATLDAGLAALKAALGPDWRRTAVLAMTEFGRTARVNGTQGTDHGTGTVAFLAGGAVAGGRVVADWPGLRAGQLFQNRDLAPTTDLLAVAKGVLAGHLGLDAQALGVVFPGSAEVAAMGGLVRG
ncbi:MAG: DUF1501 domain-containing protein [Proteobacteria bacterium]|nr:DUF1501 domain-containing protein [Pseudomonadota bacterium]